VYNYSELKVRPGPGWAWRIAFGIWLAWLIPFLLGVFVAVVLVVIGVISAASLSIPNR
jgi:hypothetical protein